MKKPFIAVTADLQDTKRGLSQLRLYQNYALSVAEESVPVIVYSKDAAQLEYLADAAQGLLLTGGGDISPKRYGETNRGKCGTISERRDELELSLIELFMKRKKPILGICRGMQLLNVYFGGSLTQDLEEERGIKHEYRSFHEVTCVDGSWLQSAFGKSFTVNSYHHQAVNALGAGLTVTAYSANDQITEGVAHVSLPVSGVQWHPERMTGSDRYDWQGPSMKPLFTNFCKLCAKGAIQ